MKVKQKPPLCHNQTANKKQLKPKKQQNPQPKISVIQKIHNHAKRKNHSARAFLLCLTSKKNPTNQRWILLYFDTKIKDKSRLNSYKIILLKE